MPGIPNFRDIGGHETADGRRVRTGRVFRSGQLDRIDVADLAGLGVRTVYDLRTDKERGVAPDRVPDGVTMIVADVLGGAVDSAAATLTTYAADVTAALRELGHGRGPDLLRDSYRQMVSLPSAVRGYRDLFAGIVAADGPSLFHCTAGKDRTGWAAAVLLTLVGVPDDVVTRDYLSSNEFVLPAYQPLLDRVAARGGDPYVLLPLLRVDEAYLGAAWDEMRQRHETVERYVGEGLGIDPEAIRAALTA
jgi:protein-tyrosine phosphatase